MTKNAMTLLRKIYDGRKRGYVLYLDGTRVLPTMGNDSLLLFDDNNEIVYSLRPSTPPYSHSSDVNILATEYAQVFCFDMDIPISDAEDILKKFVNDGIATQDQVKEFLAQMKKPWEADKGRYGELPDNKKVVQ